MSKCDAGQLYVYAGHYHTRRHHSPYISPENELRLHVTISSLDLSDPTPPDGVPNFVKPVSWSEMNKFLESNPPQGPYTDLKPQIPDTSFDRRNRWHEGDHLFVVLNRIAQAYLGDKIPQPNVDNGALVSPYRFYYHWSITSWTKPGDEHTPHLNAFLTDPDPLRPDRLNTGELSTAFGLITKSRLADGYNSHRYIPVTIFSASDRQMRILQCWHDKKNPKNLHIRRSPIMDFQEGMRENWKDWVTCICWIAGKPVGDTKNGSVAAV